MRLSGWGLLAACLGAAACTASPPSTGQLTSLRSLELAEACRLDEALAVIDRELAEADPASFRFAAALREKAVLYRDRNDDADALALETRLAELEGQPAEVVRGQTLRDVAALRQRRAATHGQPTC